MIISVEVFLEKPEIPRDYRPAIVSLIKAVLSRNYPEAYTDMYETGAKEKGFTFAVYFASPVFKKNVIELQSERVQITFSSSDECESILLYNAFQKSRGYSHPLSNGNAMRIDEVLIKAIPKLDSASATIRFLSPLVVRKHIRGEPDRYYTYEDGEFAACLNEIVSRQFNRNVELTLEPAAPKKTVVLSFGTKIRASLGIYRISGEPEVLDRLAKGGVGSRRAEGFGYFKVTGR